MTDANKLDLIREALLDWRKEELSDLSMILLTDIIVNPQELTNEDIERGKELAIEFGLVGNVNIKDVLNG